MPIKSSGQIGLTDISAEFGGPTVPTVLSNYYSGGAYVPAGTVGFPGGVSTVIPSSGRINLSNFYGSNRQIVLNASSDALSGLTIPAGRWHVYTLAVGGGGGGGAGDAGIFGTSGGPGGSIRAKFTITASQPGFMVLATGNGGTPGVGQVRDGGGGGAGRGYSFMNTSNTSDIDATINPNFRSTYCYDGSNLWDPLLEDEAIWTGLFDQQGLAARVPVAVFFPTTGNYTFQGAGDNDFFVYIDNTTSLVGNFSGFNSVKSITGFVTQGWHTIYLSAQNYGGPAGIGLRILRSSDALRIFNSRGLTDGGFTSGNFWFLNGGEGGNAGRFGSSGAGGGGGASAGLLWYPNNNPLTASPTILAIAPGGGGGAGTGRFINPGAQGGIYLSNWDNRGLIVDSGSIFTSAAGGGKPAWWTGRAAGNRVPYATSGTLKGHGGHNSSWFYPPSTEFGWTSESSSWDGGGGGGGGAPWGYAGGYAEKSDSTWVLSGPDKNNQFAWIPPNESSGAGGNQGFIFLNSNFVNSYLVAMNNTYVPNYGAGGPGGYGQGGFGQRGVLAVRVSNVDDGIYPTI